MQDSKQMQHDMVPPRPNQHNKAPPSAAAKRDRSAHQTPDKQPKQPAASSQQSAASSQQFDMEAFRQQMQSQFNTYLQTELAKQQQQTQQLLAQQQAAYTAQLNAFTQEKEAQLRAVAAERDAARAQLVQLTQGEDMEQLQDEPAE